MTAETFSNPAVQESSFPEVSDLTYEALAPSYKHTISIVWIASWLLFGTVAIIVNIVSDNDLLNLVRSYVAVPYLIMTLSALIWAPIIVKACGLAAREKDLHYRSGVIWQKTVSLPYNRIQHIEIESGPLERVFKLATLKFFTAGGGSADMKIPGLQFGRASKLKAYVLARTEAQNGNNEDKADV